MKSLPAADSSRQERKSKNSREACAALQQDPEEPAGESCSVGRYLCFSKGDWEKGLPLLARGSDETLKGSPTGN